MGQNPALSPLPHPEAPYQPSNATSSQITGGHSGARRFGNEPNSFRSFAGVWGPIRAPIVYPPMGALAHRQ